MQYHNRFTAWKETRYTLCRRLCEPHGLSGRVQKNTPPTVLDLRPVQSVPSRYTDWAIQAHAKLVEELKMISETRRWLSTETMVELLSLKSFHFKHIANEPSIFSQKPSKLISTVNLYFKRLVCLNTHYFPSLTWLVGPFISVVSSYWLKIIYLPYTLLPSFVHVHGK